MTISAMLLGGVLSTMFLSVKLVNTAPPDTNPHTFGAVAAAVARLEGSATADLTCANPSGVNSRKDCVEVASAPQTLTPHQGDLCWAVATAQQPPSPPHDDGRRLECWKLLPQGDLLAYRYAPDIRAPTPPDPLPEGWPRICSEGLASDCLNIALWSDPIEETLPRASGLAALGWECLTGAEVADPALVVPPDSCTRSFADGPARVELISCAAIRPNQRQLMALDEVPFCDGTAGVVLSDGSYRPSHDPNDWGTIEGYAMPTLRVFS